MDDNLEIKIEEKKTKEQLIAEGAMPLNNFADYFFKDNSKTGIREIYAFDNYKDYDLRNSFPIPK